MMRPDTVALLTTLLLSTPLKAQDANTSEASTTNTPTVPLMDDDIFDDGPAAPAPDADAAAEKSAGPEVNETAEAPPADTSTAKTVAELQARIDMMEEDIERLIGEQDKLNQQSALDRLNWSGDYRFIFNVFHVKQNIVENRVTHFAWQTDAHGAPIIGPDGKPVTAPVMTDLVDKRNEWLAPTWTHRLKLAMSYDFGESLRFFSQLGVYKYFNETLNTIGAIDHGSNAYPRDNAFRLERVYFDWFVTDWLAISVGRIASPDGPPTELKENTERRSGWGVQMMNATIDTLMTTFYVGKGNYLRLFYSPFGMHPGYAVNSDISLLDDQNIKLLHSWGGIFEIGLPGADDNILQLGVLHIPRFSPRETRIQVPGIAAPLPPSDFEGDNLGTYLAANSLLLLKDILGSGLDLFAAYGLTMLRPTKDRMVYNEPLSVLDAGGNETGQKEIHVEKIGLASYEEGADSTNFGHTIYAGFRYTLPMSKRYPTRLGGEINWGTKYHIAWSHPNEQLVNKLGNKGLAFEGYLIQQLVPDHLFVRVGYLELRRDYLGSFVGPTMKVDQQIRNINMTVDLAW